MRNGCRERNGGGDLDGTTDNGDLGSGSNEHTNSSCKEMLSDRERRVSPVSFYQILDLESFDHYNSLVVKVVTFL